jgi:hypothetical protein
MFTIQHRQLHKPQQMVVFVYLYPETAVKVLQHQLLLQQLQQIQQHVKHVIQDSVYIGKLPQLEVPQELLVADHV